MKRLWQRHRNWAYSVLPGIAVFALLFWWLTPQPEFRVELPAIPDEIKTLPKKPYLYMPSEKGDGLRAARQQRWLSVRLYSDGCRRVYLIDSLTGRLIQDPNFDGESRYSFGFDRTERFLSSSKSGSLSEGTEVFDWFNPNTGSSGSISIPREIDENGKHIVSADHSAFLQLAYTDGPYCEFRRFDFETQSLSIAPLIPRESAPQDYLPPHILHVSESAREVAIPNTEVRGFDVYDVLTGKFIDTRHQTNCAFMEVSDIRFPEGDVTLPESQVNDVAGRIKDVIDISDDRQRVLCQPWRRRPMVTSASGDTVRNYPTSLLQYRGRNSVMSFIGRKHAVVVLGKSSHHPGMLETFITPITKRLGLKPKFKANPGNAAYYWDLETNKTSRFRFPKSGEEIAQSVAIRGDRVCLLINPRGSNPTVEIWQTPPQERPTLAIWLASLTVTFGSAYWIRRHQRRSEQP